MREADQEGRDRGQLDAQEGATARPKIAGLQGAGQWGEVLAEVAARLGAIYAAQNTGLNKKDVTIDIAEAFAAEMGARPVKAAKPQKPAKKLPRNPQKKPQKKPQERSADAMPINILMPALSPTMEKGKLAKWLKKEGDKVKSGDVIAEIETDKATMEVEAVDEGTIAKIVVPEGTADVTVNQLIAVLAGEGEDVESGRRAAPAALRRHRSRKAAAAPQTEAAEGRRSKARGVGGTRRRSAEAASGRAAGAGHRARRVFASPLARRLAKEAGIELSRIQGSGPHGRVIARDVEAREVRQGR